VQHAAELDDVPPGLNGHRTPASVFMSAQHAFRWGGKKDSLGRTGVREARLTANTASNNRAGNFIGGILSHIAIYERAGIDRRIEASVLLFF
jgi:hypothetical protein